MIIPTLIPYITVGFPFGLLEVTFGPFLWIGLGQDGDVYISGCFTTPLEHTPSNLYQQAVFRDSFRSWLGVLFGVCSRGVLQFSWIIGKMVASASLGIGGPKKNQPHG